MTRLTVGNDRTRRLARRLPGGGSGPRRPGAFGLVQVMVGAALVAGVSVASPVASVATTTAPPESNQTPPADEPSQGTETGADGEAASDAEAPGSDQPTKEPAEKPNKQEGSDDKPAKEKPTIEGGESPGIGLLNQHLPTFDCSPGAPGMLFQHEGPPSTGPTTGKAVDIVTGDWQPVLTVTDGAVNAVGYNVLDDYMYGWDVENGEIVRVGSDGNTDRLNVPAGHQGVAFAIIGDVDDNGHYWYAHPGTGRWHQVDLDPNSPTFMTVLETGVIDPWPGMNDWAFVPGTNSLYTVGRDQNGDNTLLRFDRTTQTFTVEGSLGTSAIATGAVYADPDGFLYTSNNNDGLIHRIDIGNVTAAEFADGPASHGNDGARCASSPIPIDFGDAPAGYGTTLVDDGPRHVIGNYDAATNTAPLMLGSGIDSETDGVPSGAADGDGADEDGVGAPIVMTGTQETTVSVSATNNTNEDAILAGWIDLDGNGSFDPGERVTQTVPANSGLGSYDLTFPGGTAGADTYARFRLFPGSTDPAGILPTGSAAGGEVEDHLVEYRALEVDKTSDATADMRAGDTVTYEVTVTNPGTADYTAADPALVTDDLSDVLDDATFDTGSLSADRAGTVDFADPMVSWEGALAAGDSVVISYEVELTGDGDRVVRNVACVPEALVTPGEDPCDETEFELPALIDYKEVDPGTGTSVTAGEELTYTVTFTNEGEAAGMVARVDDLSHILDDADLVDGPAVSDAALAVSGPDGDGRIGVTGELDPDQTVTVTYTVRVRESGERGDDALANFLLDPGQEPPPEPECEPADGELPDCTFNPIEPALPVTGISLGTSSLVGLGSALLLAGMVLVAAGRRNRVLATGERSVRFGELF